MPVKEMEGGKDMEDDPIENVQEDIDSDEEGAIRIDDIYIPPPPKQPTAEKLTGPRLILNKIVNYNFKSYAGTKVIGPFHQCFSAIVGPNGSGKSNIIDSMLFVFGYRANKIRSKKVSYLIHNSKEFPNANECKVAVHFQFVIDKEDGAYDIVPNSEFIISRTAFKDNSSYYELDGKKVQFKQIAKLLRSYGVDLDHNRFLILQGEVEQISLMKPKGQGDGDTGMLEFLEDIIGTNRYKEPLEKLFNKVELLTEHRVDKLNRLRIAEKNKKELEEPMKEAVEYLKIQNSIIRLQHQLYQLKKSEVSKTLTEEEDKQKELTEDLEKLKKEMENLSNQQAEKQKIMKEKSEKWDKLQHEKDDKSDKLTKLQKKDEALHAEMVSQNKMRKDCMAAAKAEKAKLEELKDAPAKHEKEIEECEQMNEKNIAKREAEEAKLAKLMSEFDGKAKPLIEQRSTLENELITKRKSVEEAKAKHALAKKKLDIYVSTEETEKSKYEKLQQAYKADLEMVKERKEQLAPLIAKIGPTEKSLKQAQKELTDIQNKEAALREQLNAKRSQYDEHKCAMSSNRSRNKVLNALMEQKRCGNIPGILGRLGDLGGIDAKYDVAVSTACGLLDHIVVDTVQTANVCIEFLRKHGIGRGSFIPLEKQQRYKDQCQQRIKTPENIPRLFDLIKVENQNVLVAFYFALRDTLVADNLEQATRIAYGAKRYRVVSLRGELIELSGTMSGGGKSVSRGRMGQSVARSEPSSTDLEKLQVDLDKIYEECERLKAAQPPLEDQIRTLTKALQQMLNDKNKYEIDIKTANDRLPTSRQELKKQEKKVKETVSDPKQVKKMTAEVEQAEAEVERVQEDSAKTENEVKRLTSEIDKLYGNNVKQSKKIIGDLTKAIDKAKSEIYRLRVAIKAAARNAKNAEQSIQNNETNVKNCEDRLRAINAERQELETEAREITEAIETLNEQLKERDELLHDLRKELSGIHSRESSMKHVKLDLDHKLSEKNKLLKELKQRLLDLEKKITTLRLHAIPNETEEELKIFTEEEVEELAEKNLEAKLQRVKENLPEQTPNLQLIREYQEKDELYLKRAEELDVITTERNKVRDMYEMVRRKRSSEFLCGFDVITKKLKEMYQMITLGGDAELELVDTIDPFSEGIVFSVRPPKKSWKNINNLSGGEKTLSSLALVFALHHYKPTPLYFMDEIDAALDFKNVSIVGHYIKERTKNAQFIVISLRSNMFELADYLVGIYKTFNCTKIACISLSTFYETYGIPPPVQATCSQPTQVACSQPAPSTSVNYQNNDHMILSCPPAVMRDKEVEKTNEVEKRNDVTATEQREEVTNGHEEVVEEEQQVEREIGKKNKRETRRSKGKKESLNSSTPNSSQVNTSSESEADLEPRRSKRCRKT